MNKDAVIETIKTGLEALGSTSDEVAAKLKDLGITGIRNNATFCPIAKYLKTIIPDGYAISSVNPDHVIAFDLITSEMVLIEGTPTPVYQFIGMFDRDSFPELVSN